MSYAIRLADGRAINGDGWTQDQAERYLEALLEQAGSEDGMGDDLEEAFGPVLDDYEAILAGAHVVSVAAGSAPPNHGVWISPSTVDWAGTGVAERQSQTAASGRARNEFGVQFLGESKRVVVGRVDEAQDSLVGEPQDATENAVQAVAEYVIHAFDGALEIEYDDGVTYQIQVVKIGQRHPDGSRYGLHPGGMIVGYR